MEGEGNVSSIVYSGINVIMFVIGFFGNIITLVVIFKGTAFRIVGQGRLFLANLAVIDLMGSIDCLISAIGYINPNWIQNNKIFCEFEGGRRWFMRIMITSSLLMLSINRYAATKVPLKINTIFSKRNSCILIFASWVFGTLNAVILKLVDQRPALFRPFEGSCMLRTGTVTTIVLMGVLFLPMTTTIGYCNITIYKLVNNQRNRIANHTGRQCSDNSLLNRNLRLLKITLGILLSFLISHSTVPAFMIMDDILGTPMQLVWYRLCRTLLSTNHTINIFIYAVMDKAYRQQVKTLFCRKNWHHNQSAIALISNSLAQQTYGNPVVVLPKLNGSITQEN